MSQAQQRGAGRLSVRALGPLEVMRNTNRSNLAPCASRQSSSGSPCVPARSSHERRSSTEWGQCRSGKRCRTGAYL